MPKLKKLRRNLAFLNNNSSEWSPTQLSVAPAAWYQPGVGVTGTLTASNWADQSGNGRDLAQGTAGNQPIYLPYSGTPYAYLPGVSGNYYSTPDSAENSITGDIDLRFCAALDNWGTTGQAFCGKRSSGNSYQFTSGSTTNTPIFYWWQGTVLKSAEANSAWSIAAGVKKHIRVTLDVDNGSGGCDARFYTSDDGETWVQLGTTVTQAFTASIDDTASTLDVGTDGSAGYLLVGKIYRAQIYNGIDGTLAVDFNPSTFTETSTNGATAVASTGETWTLNSTGAKPAQIVKSAQLLLTTAGLTYMTMTYSPSDPQTLYMVIKQNGWTANHGFWSSGTPGVDDMNVTQQTATPRIGLYAGAAACENSDAAIGSYAVGCFQFNGASSLVQVNAGTATTGNPGTTSGTTVNLSRESVGADFQVKEIILFPSAHSAAERLLVQRYLANKYSIVL